MIPDYLELSRLMKYRVSELGAKYPVYVTFQSSTTWGVENDGNQRLSITGFWDHTPLPSNRTNEWKEEHSWLTFDDAYKAALLALDYIKVTGFPKE